MRNRGLTVVVAIALGALTTASAGAVPTTPRVDRIDCNTTVLQILGIDLTELVGDPCRSAQGGIELPLGGGNHIYVLRGATAIVPGLDGPQGATSQSTVLDLTLLTDLVPVRVLNSEAYVTCASGRPQLSGGSETIGGVDVPLAAPFEVNAPLQLGDVVFVNETVATSTGVTQRALRVATPGGDIVLSEATAGFSKNPCKRIRRPRR